MKKLKIQPNKISVWKGGGKKDANTSVRKRLTDRQRTHKFQNLSLVLKAKVLMMNYDGEILQQK